MRKSYSCLSCYIDKYEGILLIKEKQEKHKEFMVVNKGKEETKRQKHPLIYSNR